MNNRLCRWGETAGNICGVGVKNPYVTHTLTLSFINTACAGETLGSVTQKRLSAAALLVLFLKTSSFFFFFSIREALNIDSDALVISCT